MSLPSATTIAKFLAALAGVAGIIISSGLISSDTAKWVNVGIAGATALAVYFVPNKATAAAPVAAPKTTT